MTKIKIYLACKKSDLKKNLPISELTNEGKKKSTNFNSIGLNIISYLHTWCEEKKELGSHQPSGCVQIFVLFERSEIDIKREIK